MKAQTKPDVELHVCYDMDHTEWVSDNYFETLYRSRRGDDVLFFYTDGGKYDLPQELKDCYDISACSEKDFRNWCIKHSDMNVRDLCRYKLSNEYSWYECWIEMLDNDLEGFSGVSKNGDLPEAPNNGKILYYIQTAPWSNQGDCFTCLVSNECKEYVTSHYLDRLINGAPIYAILRIDNEVIFLSEMLSDPYEWNYEEVLIKLRTRLEEMGIDSEHIEDIIDMIPDDIEC